MYILEPYLTLAHSAFLMSYDLVKDTCESVGGTLPTPKSETSLEFYKTINTGIFDYFLGMKDFDDANSLQYWDGKYYIKNHYTLLF